MDHAISCPACKAAITLSQLVWTATLLRFKCPHCATRVQPTDNTFATRWFVIAAVVGLLAGLAAAIIAGLTRDAAERGLAYVGLVILVAGAIAVIKWRASLALIKKTELKIVP
jgi:prepilin signal peptidase PulO-like enzyme (type II secretory pathway)